MLTTESNELLRPLHKRMPVFISEGFEEDWMTPVKDGFRLKQLEQMLKGWNPDGWSVEPLKPVALRMNLF